MQLDVGTPARERFSLGVTTFIEAHAPLPLSSSARDGEGWLVGMISSPAAAS